MFTRHSRSCLLKPYPMVYLYVTVCLPTGYRLLVYPGLLESGMFGHLGSGLVQLTKDFLSSPGNCWASAFWSLG